MTVSTLKKIYHYLIDSKKLHQEYLESGKKFIPTKKIRQINQGILDLIIQQNSFPLELEKPINDLKEHLIDWIEHWEKEKLNLNPKSSTIFIFEGYKLFPKNTDKIIEDYINNSY